MNKTVTITSKNHKYANTYGGNICQSDFCTDYTGSRNVASEIFSNWKFDSECGKHMANSIRLYKTKQEENK